MRGWRDIRSSTACGSFLKGRSKASKKPRSSSPTVRSAGLTLHTFDGTIPQLRRSLDRSLDAFFDLLPGADDEDVETFGD